MRLFVMFVSEREINDLVEKRHSAQTRRKNQQIGPYQPFEVIMCSSNILELLFSDLATIKKKKKHSAQSFRKKIFLGFECFRRANVAHIF